MTEHLHIALFHRAHEAFERGDTEAMRAWFADDFVWHEPGNNPLTGDYRGADEVFGLFSRIRTATTGISTRISRTSSPTTSIWSRSYISKRGAAPR